MGHAVATRTLLAPRADVWAFLAEPHRMADWWPGIAGVEPDRRGFAAGARWQVRAGAEPGLLRGPFRPGLLLVREAREPELAAWHLTGNRLDVRLELAEQGPDRTAAALEVSAPWNAWMRRTLPQRALARLYDLCQTSAPAG